MKKRSLAQRVLRRVLDPLQYAYMKHVRSGKKFTLAGEDYSYNLDRYNFSWVNERSAEIPIFQKIISKTNDKVKILEVGNVLSHYQKIHHRVIDKYEKSSNVINEDIAHYLPKEKYDLIFSISTLEHVGWDEAKKDSLKIIKSFENMQSMLTKGGEIWFSVPLGYNPHLDEIVAADKLPKVEMYFLQRISGFTNLWQEIPMPSVADCAYGRPYPHANVLMIGVYRKKQ